MMAGDTIFTHEEAKGSSSNKNETEAKQPLEAEQQQQEEEEGEEQMTTSSLDPPLPPYALRGVSYSSVDSSLYGIPEQAQTPTAAAAATEEEEFDLAKKPAADTLCRSGNYSCSSEEGTARTRIETMDSTVTGNLDGATTTTNTTSRYDIYEYDVDHRFLSGSRTASVDNKSPTAAMVPEPPTTTTNNNPPDDNNTRVLSCLMLPLRIIHRSWMTITTKLRDMMLRVVIAISVKAAQYPRITIIGVTAISFALIIAGFMTNMDVRLDSTKIFTPSGSELNEYSRYTGNKKMYENPDLDNVRQRQRQLLQFQQQQQHTIATTTSSTTRSLAVKLIILDKYANQTDTVVYLNDTTITTDDSNDNVTTTSNLPDATNHLNNTSSYLPDATSHLDNTNTTTIITTTTATTISHNATDAEAVNETTTGEDNSEGEGEDETASALENTGHGMIIPFLIHANKENVFTIEGVHKVFDVVEYIFAIPGFQESCIGHSGGSGYRNIYGEYTCELRAITRFWNHNRTLFEEEIKTQEDLFNAADAIFYPDGGFVDLPFVLAELEEDALGRPIAGQAFFAWLFTKDGNMESVLNTYMLGLRNDMLRDKSDPFVLEFASPNSYEDGAKGAIIGDLPLLPVVFGIMCVFTCLVFFKFHLVHSRSLLGIGAVLTIFMSVLSGYGLLFASGVPMTIMTNLLIFIIFGIGLDDTFIITGAYFRSSHEDDPVERIKRTMEAVGSSILLTSITTSVAFILGSMSTVLPIRWLCLYAFPTVMIDFFYQITFFVALLVLDERRIQANRMDCCVCITISRGQEEEDEEEGDRTCVESPTSQAQQEQEPEANPQHMRKQRSLDYIEMSQERHSFHHGPYESDHVADRFMRWFAERLMHPAVKLAVLAGFASFAGFCAYRTTKLRQQFNFKDLLPKGSHVASYVTAAEYYSDRALFASIEFRFVDQSDPEIRRQMEAYINDLVENVDAMNEEPPMCWVREFRNYIAADETLHELSFYEQLDILLSNPTIYDAFGKDILFRDDGTIVASKCTIYITDIDMEDVKDQIKFMEQQREVTARQPINKGKKLWAFFTYDILFHIFAFYEVAANELTTTTISSVLAVCLIAFLLIPHWSATLIIFPIISMLFIEMMGVLEMFGYSVNVVTYVILVISIGLLVDFIMHILLRYYESEFETREEKVKDALGTMGASILVGGLSTFLGVTPLIFSSSEIFSTICLAFLAMVFLGVTHGLILLPVILSYVGTERVVRFK